MQEKDPDLHYTDRWVVTPCPEPDDEDEERFDMPRIYLALDDGECFIFTLADAKRLAVELIDAVMTSLEVSRQALQENNK